MPTYSTELYLLPSERTNLAVIFDLHFMIMIHVQVFLDIPRSLLISGVGILITKERKDGHRQPRTLFTFVTYLLGRF